jgi:MFS family permease
VFFSFGSLFISTFGVFLKPVAADMQWSRAQLPAAFTVAVLSVAASGPLWGRLMDRVPARRVVLPCIFVYGVGFFSLAFLTRHLVHLFAVYAVMGIAALPTVQLGYVKVVSAWFDQARGRALAAVMAGSGIGFMVFPPMAQSLISAAGWRTAYTVLGASVLVVSLPLSWFFLHEPDGFTRASETKGNAASGPIVSFPFLGIVSGLLLFSFAANGLNTHWSPLLTDGGLSPATAASVLAIAGVASLTSKLVTGYLLDRFPANRVAAVLLFCSALGLLATVATRSVGSAFTGAVLVGIGMGAESDAVPYLLTRYFGLERLSELYGYTWTVYAIAGALGPLFAGLVFDKTGNYRSALLLFFMLVVVASGVFAMLPKYDRTKAA